MAGLPVTCADDFPRWWPRLVGAARRYLPAEAEDIAQEALIRCCRAEARGQLVNLGYAYTAVRSCALDEARRPVHHVEQVPLEHWHVVRTPDPSLGPILAEALAGLLPRQALVVTLIASGYGHGEIAELIGTTAGFVNQLCRRARYRARRGEG